MDKRIVALVITSIPVIIIAMLVSGTAQQTDMASQISASDANGCVMTLTGPAVNTVAQWVPVNSADPRCAVK